MVTLAVLGACDGGDEGCPEVAIEGCALDTAQGDLVCTLEHEGQTRGYRVVVPEAAACAPAPLVFDLHGLTSNPVQQEWISGLARLGREEGFIAVHPEGSGDVRSWNAGSCCGTAARDGVDDVGFLDAIRARLATALSIDPRRVYATGLSNGGYLAHRLACERADVYAAIAPVAGVLGVPRCDSARPVPVFQVHGTADQLVPYLGGGMGGGLSAPATVQWWAERNQCDATPVLTFAHGDVTCERRSGCAGGADVELCTVSGGGHSWPGGPDLILPALGATSPDLDATAALWAFFEEHPMPEAPVDGWTPRADAAVPDEPAAGDECALGPAPASSSPLDARLVLPDDEAPPASSGGDPVGRWTIESADLYLPPIATHEVLPAESLVQAAGRADLGDDGVFALVLDLDGEISTSSYGALHLRRRVRATGAWQIEGSDLLLAPECGGLAGSPGEVPASAGFSRLDDDHARISWVVSSGLIGDVTLVVGLQRTP